MPKPPRRSTSRPGAANRPPGTNQPGTDRPAANTGSGSRAVRPKRLARREVRESFLERNRTRLLWASLAVAVVAIGALFYFQATAAAYACRIEWTAEGTPSPAPDATPRMGYVQQDMGHDHVNPGTVVRYLYCPPASGEHYPEPGGPIAQKLYGPNDRVIPQGWVHNLEHGLLVLLYKCPGDACTDAGQAALQQLWASWPASPVCDIQPPGNSPVIARFDDMAYPYAALVWDQVLPLQTLDTQAILAFYAQQGERTNPEKQCAPPSPGPSGSPNTASTEAPAQTPTEVPGATSTVAPSPTVEPAAS